MLFVYGVSYSQKTDPNGRPFIKNFTPIDYNAEGQNWSFTQDSTGFIFSANTGGILVFDGRNWRKFKPENRGVPLCFAKGPNNAIYCGGTNYIGVIDTDSLGFFKAKSLTHLLPDEYNLGYVRKSYGSSDWVYFQTNDGLLKYDGQQLATIDFGNTIHFMHYFDGELILDTSEGVYSLDPQKSVVQPSKINWPQEVTNIRSILKGTNGTIIFTYDNGVFFDSNDQTISLEGITNDFLKESKIQHAISLPDGNYGIATKTSGVLIVNQNLEPVWRLNKYVGMYDDDVKALFLDRENNIWMGNNRGISKIEYPIVFSYFDAVADEIGTVEDFVWMDDVLYFASSAGTYELGQMDQKDLLSNIPLPEIRKLEGSEVENFAISNWKGGIIFGGGDALKYQKDNQVTTIDFSDSRKLLLSKVRDQAIYYGHAEGVKIIEDGGDKFHVTELNLPSSEYRGIAETLTGDLWLTTLVKGAYFINFDSAFDRYEVTHFGVDDGLPADRDNLVYNVDNKIYFTTHQGIYTYDSLQSKFRPDYTFGEINDLEPCFIYSFHYDGRGEVWYNAYDKRQTYHAIRQPDGSWLLENNSFTAMNQMQVYDILKQDNGVVWFGGSDALVRYEPSRIKSVAIPYYARVIELTVNGDSVVYGGSKTDDFQLSLNPESREIRFEVAALTYRNSRVISFQYQLEGLDERWSEWTNESFRIYNNLPYGEYSFRVRARNEFDEHSIEDKFNFLILPFWYETWWFKAAFSVILGLMSFYLIRFFAQRKLIKKVEEIEAIRKLEKDRDEAVIREKRKGIASILKAQEAERQRIAKDLHDGIVQEIGSNIIRWRNLLASDHPIGQKANELIASLENSNAELRALSHQMMPKALSALGVIAALEGLLDGSLKPLQIEYEFENFGISERLPENLEIAIYRIAQELIQNITKHSQASHVNIQLFKVGSDINLIVEDDGVGFDFEQAFDGIGMHNIKSRLDPLNGTIHFEAGPQRGTLATVKIPLTNV